MIIKDLSNVEKHKNYEKLLNENGFKEFYVNSRNDETIPKIWYQELMNMKDSIDRIYEIHQPGFLGAWYYVVDKNNNPFIAKHSINDVNTSFMMSSFLKDSGIDVKTIRVDENMLFDLFKKESTKSLSIDDIYEIDQTMCNGLFNQWRCGIKSNYLSNNFIIKNKKGYTAIDNTNGDWYCEDFSNKEKCKIYLTRNHYMPSDVEKHYKEYKGKISLHDVKSKDNFCDKYDLYQRDFLVFKQNEKYEFQIGDLGLKGYAGQKFESTIVNALGLASNYESDLSYKGHIIFSPLGFEWEYNKNLIDKYTNNRLKSEHDFGLPYRSPDDSCILWVKDKKVNQEISIKM